MLVEGAKGGFGKSAADGAHRVRNEIGHRKGGPENQVPDRGAANAVDQGAW